MALTERDYELITNVTVYDRDGHKVGRAGRLYLDDKTNKPTWLTVIIGFFSTSESFVPLMNADLYDDRLTVPYTKALIKDSPQLSGGGSHLDPAEEERLRRYYHLTAEAEDVVDYPAAREDARDAAATVTAAEERLNVGTEEVEAGRAHVSKYVTTEQQTVTVPVEKEHLVVQREPLLGDTHRARIDPTSGVEDIVLREERPVVSKEVHETERVTVGKETVTEQQAVTGEVQKEHIAVEEEIRPDREL